MKNAPTRNRKASFDVAIEETYEAGLALTGDEIKSIRAGRSQMTGGYIRVRRDTKGAATVSLIGLHLSLARDPERIKKLLLHNREIEKIEKALQAKGRVAVPLRLYLSHGWAKITLGVGTGRKQYDKRALIKERDAVREQKRFIKGIN